MECKEAASNHLCHFHEIEPDHTVDVNSWRGCPHECDQGWADGIARWSERCSSWNCKVKYTQGEIAVYTVNDLDSYLCQYL